MNYNEETKIITSNVYVEQDAGENRVYICYLVFEIDYNFETETLNGFTLHGFMGYESNISAAGVNYFRFENNSLKRLNPSAQSFADFATQTLGNLSVISASEWAENRPDYSDEYNSAFVPAN